MKAKNGISNFSALFPNVALDLHSTAWMKPHSEAPFSLRLLGRKRSIEGNG